MLPDVLALMHRAFAPMDGVIDPPSSLARMTLASLAQPAVESELWVIAPSDQPIACVTLTPKADTLYIGKLATDPARQRSGLARRLIALAEVRARALNLPSLSLQTRVELTANHATFRALGFAQTGATAHPGYDRPTSLTFTKPLP
ncbi:GNAT family N-acetyltransferase [Rhodobacteraceae bacterium D3-12]|nr:GNAT family N-acetyltransferase [Rhodobacteraceae bacterium D3-12]